MKYLVALRYEFKKPSLFEFKSKKEAMAFVKEVGHYEHLDWSIAKIIGEKNGKIHIKK
jgi:hypothetical protein